MCILIVSFILPNRNIIMSIFIATYAVSLGKTDGSIAPTVTSDASFVSAPTSATGNSIYVCVRFVNTSQ